MHSINTWTAFEIETMKMLINEARKNINTVRPNPPVAAAVVQGSTVISIGVHQTPGDAHAEVIALNSAGKDAEGATLLITLEPCTHFGRTPPCTDAIISSGVSNVIYAAEDPNPKVRKVPAKKQL